MHKVGMRLICINVIVQNMEIVEQNVINYTMLSYFLFKDLHKQASEFSSRIMVDGAKFNSHDSGSHFQKPTFKNLKMATARISNIFAIKFKLQVRLSMQSLHRYRVYTSYGVKISIFLTKNLGMRLKLPIAPLIIIASRTTEHMGNT